MQETITQFKRMTSYKIGSLPTGSCFYFPEDRHRIVWVIVRPVKNSWKHKGHFYSADKVHIQAKHNAAQTRVKALQPKDVSADKTVIFLNNNQ